MKHPLHWQGITRDGKRISGITKRWFRTTLSAILVVYLVLAIFLILIIRNYYYDAVDLKLNSQFTGMVNSYFSQDRGSRSFEDLAQDYIRSYNQKDKVEVWAIDQNGKVVESSGGFAVDPTESPDYEEALRSPSRSGTFTGRDDNGEKIKAATFLVNSDGQSKCAIRYIISLKEIDKQLLIIVAMVLLFYLILISFHAVPHVIGFLFCSLCLLIIICGLSNVVFCIGINIVVTKD